MVRGLSEILARLTGVLSMRTQNTAGPTARTSHHWTVQQVVPLVASIPPYSAPSDEDNVLLKSADLGPAALGHTANYGALPSPDSCECSPLSTLLPLGMEPPESKHNHSEGQGDNLPVNMDQLELSEFPQGKSPGLLRIGIKYPSEMSQFLCLKGSETSGANDRCIPTSATLPPIHLHSPQIRSSETKFLVQK